MNNLNHWMVFFTVSTFMMGVTSLLPGLVRHFQERLAARSATRETRAFNQFFTHIKPTYIMLGTMAVGLILGLITESWVLAGFFILAGVVAPKIVLSIWQSIRTSQFDDQLMDALILMGNALRSGLDIASGVELVASNMKPPISEEFGLVLNAYRLGGSLEGALMDMTKRIRSRTLETVVVAIILQRETGGNLIRTFDQLIQTIREEGKLQKKVKAISAQGRTQIAFLSVFPWAMAAILYLLSPEMIQPALTETWGQMALAVMVVWELIGIAVTKRIVTVDV